MLGAIHMALNYLCHKYISLGLFEPRKEPCPLQELLDLHVSISESDIKYVANAYRNLEGKFIKAKGLAGDSMYDEVRGKLEAELIRIGNLTESEAKHFDKSIINICEDELYVFTLLLASKRK